MILRDFPITHGFLEQLIAQFKEKHPNFSINFAAMYKKLHLLYKPSTQLVISGVIFEDFYFLPENRESLLLMCVDNNPPEDPIFPPDEYYEWLRLAIIIHRNDIAIKLHAHLQTDRRELFGPINNLDFIAACVAANNIEMFNYLTSNGLVFEPQAHLLLLAIQSNNMTFFDKIKEEYDFHSVRDAVVTAAIVAGDLEKLRRFHLTKKQLNSMPVLAIQHDALEVLHFLINNCAVTPTPDFLYQAILAKNLKIVRYLAETFYFNIDKDECCEAAASSNLEIVEYLNIRFYLNMYPSDDEKCNERVLNSAACHADLPTLKYFIEKLGYVPTTKTLNAAVSSGSLEKTIYLKEKYRLALNNATIHVAIRGNNIQVLKYLLGNHPRLQSMVTILPEQMTILKYLLNRNIQNAQYINVPTLATNAQCYTRGLSDAANTFQEGISLFVAGVLEEGWQYFRASAAYSLRQFFHYATDAYLRPTHYGVTEEHLGRFNAHYHEAMKTIFDMFPRTLIEAKTIDACIDELIEGLEKQGQTTMALAVKRDFKAEPLDNNMNVQPAPLAL